MAAIKVLLREGNELRLRMPGEGRTSLQEFLSQLDAMDEVEYANFFLGHPELDAAELYLRTKKGHDPADVLVGVCGNLRQTYDDLAAALEN